MQSGDGAVVASDDLNRFLAGGGAAYFGADVRIAPEDVFCYATAVPRVIRSGISRREEMSVSGPRGGEYAADTPGEPFDFAGDASCIPEDPVYSGIRSYTLTQDIISALPPESWGYTRYGRSFLLDGDPSLEKPQNAVLLRELRKGKFELRDYSNIS